MICGDETIRDWASAHDEDSQLLERREVQRIVGISNAKLDEIRIGLAGSRSRAHRPRRPWSHRRRRVRPGRRCVPTIRHALQQLPVGPGRRRIARIHVADGLEALHRGRQGARPPRLGPQLVHTRHWDASAARRRTQSGRSASRRSSRRPFGRVAGRLRRFLTRAGPSRTLSDVAPSRWRLVCAFRKSVRSQRPRDTARTSRDGPRPRARSPNPTGSFDERAAAERCRGTFHKLRVNARLALGWTRAALADRCSAARPAESPDSEFAQAHSLSESSPSHRSSHGRQCGDAQVNWPGARAPTRPC